MWFDVLKMIDGKSSFMSADGRLLHQNFFLSIFIVKVLYVICKKRNASNVNKIASNIFPNA